MALQSVGSGWEARPLQSKASMSVATGALSATQVLDMVSQAVAEVEDESGWLRVGERSANKVSVSIRDMTRESSEPVLFFDVEVDRAVGRVTVRTLITSYVVKSSGMSALVPMAKRRVVGFNAYRAFMDRYARMLSKADPAANVSFSGD
ncbi:hypothetical protein J1G42_08375 [Cellulomonas sp. zg-ZUI222]|uniref:Uncharacterized protein n=1 Tax=Cellulomonas wangleii TaxID=2816956 RepID=A0ABX8D095_9CELL|nr:MULTISPECIES: hypothetical protein [Cellulomonas]MBO0900244.1 hypothetical protein [Cellulomonas sp. zg-ZUI22]MBO0920842.1 hypothetical protein [Cellulomonas wangleii]MBO0926562.1 hypothetical protein [Cellulomonas wangleii]QVI60874.1 hypothetical protein KG103_09940 [Cellulomonas wangleii]